MAYIPTFPYQHYETWPLKLLAICRFVLASYLLRSLWSSNMKRAPTFCVGWILSKLHENRYCLSYSSMFAQDVEGRCSLMSWMNEFLHLWPQTMADIVPRSDRTKCMLQTDISCLSVAFLTWRKENICYHEAIAQAPSQSPQPSSQSFLLFCPALSTTSLS